MDQQISNEITMWFANLSSPPAPPSILLWVAVVTAVLAVLKFILGLIQRRSDKNKSVYDTLWYRTLIIPECWNPIVSLIAEYVNKLQQLKLEKDNKQIADSLQTLCIDFQSDKENIAGRLILLRPFNELLPSKIQIVLDNLEDELVDFCGSLEFDSQVEIPIFDYLETVFWTKLEEVCSTMMTLHPKRPASF